MKISIIYCIYKKNIKRNLLEEYVNFVDLTKKQNKYFRIVIILFTVTMLFFLSFVSLKYRTKCFSCKYKNTCYNTIINI